MIAEPPLDGAVHDSATLESPAVPARLVGCPGTANGVDVTVDDAVPVPTAFTVETLNVYSVPLVRPVTIPFAVALVPSENVDHDVPASDEYSNL